MKRMIYFAAHRLIGSKIAEYYREFHQVQRAQPAELERLQRFRLLETLRNASENIPLYRARSRQDAPELTTFPILTKNVIRDNFERMMSPALLTEYKNQSPRRGYGWCLVKTGGSSGTPTSVIHTAEFRDRGRASRLYSQYLCGFPISTPYIRLWGSMNEINHMQDSLQQRGMRWLLNENLLNAFQMSDAAMESYITFINGTGIEHMMAYTDAAHELARFCLKNGFTVRSLSSLMACAGTVTDDFRSCFNSVFHSRIHNKYGSRDCADIACECEQGGLHIYANNLFLEVVDENGLHLPPGQVGRILVTLFANHDFPLIRYEIGDYGALAEGKCACGRPFPLLQKLEGRAIEFLRNSDGTYVSPVFVRHLIGVVHNPSVLRRFQLTQDSLVDYTLRFEVEDSADPVVLKSCLAAIDRDLKAVLGSKSTIHYEQVDLIAPSPSGKFLYTRCNLAGVN